MDKTKRKDNGTLTDVVYMDLGRAEVSLKNAIERDGLTEELKNAKKHYNGISNLWLNGMGDNEDCYEIMGRIRMWYFNNEKIL